MPNCPFEPASRSRCVTSRRFAGGLRGALFVLSLGLPTHAQKLVADLQSFGRYENPDSATGELVRLGDRILFAADDGIHGVELMAREPGGVPYLVADLIPGVEGSNPHGFLGHGTHAYFGCTKSSGLTTIWVTDGTQGGTKQVRTLPSGATHFPQHLRYWKGLVWFWRLAGVGAELIACDARGGFTVMADSTNLQVISPLVAAGGRLFFAGWDPNHGRELWVTDGTRSGTGIVVDLKPGPLDSDPHELTAVGAHLVFVANAFSSGQQIWASDGTASGTQPWTNFVPSLPFLSISRLVPCFSGVLFDVASALPVPSGVWYSDGTPFAARFLVPRNPGSGARTPVRAMTTDRGSLIVTNDGRTDEVFVQGARDRELLPVGGLTAADGRCDARPRSC